MVCNFKVVSSMNQSMNKMVLDYWMNIPAIVQLL